MKVIDITRGKTALQRLIAEFEKTSGFSDFSKVIDYALKEEIKDIKLLKSIWNLYKNTLPEDNYLPILSDIISKIEISYTEIEKIRREEYLNNRNEKTTELVHKMLESLTEEEERKQHYRQKYSWFTPSLNICEFIENVYPDKLNPGYVIADFIKVYYPSNCVVNDLDFYEFYCPQKIYKVEYNADIIDLLKDIAKTVISLSDFDDKQQEILTECLMAILDPYNIKDVSYKYGLGDKLSVMYQVQKDLFYAWLNYSYVHDLSFIDGNRAITEEDFKDIFKYMCFGIYSVPSIFVSNREHANEYFENINLTNISKNFYLSYSALFKILENYFSFSDGKYNDITKAALGWLNLICTKTRNELLGGIAPFDYSYSHYSASTIVDNVGLKDADLLLSILIGHYDNSDISLTNYNAKCDYYSLMNYYNEKQETYITLYKKAVAEGHPQLGIALLSLYILVRTFAIRAKFGNFPELIAVLDEAIKLPGNKILKHTLKIACDGVTTHFPEDVIAVASMKIFERYITPEATLHVLQGGKEDKEEKGLSKDVQAILERELGKERWLKLTPESRKTLISAESLWQNSAMEFGFGIQDWSGIITPYCKMFEIELVQKMKPFYMSEEYKEYQVSKGQKKDAKPTGGSLLYEVKSYQNLPEPLQKLLSDCPIKLVENKDLILGLVDIVTNYRNKSAHTEIMGMKRYTEFREKIYEKKLLHSFIDAFC